MPDDTKRLIERVVARYSEASRASTFELKFQTDGTTPGQSLNKFGAFEVLRSGDLTYVRSTQVNRNSVWIVGREKVWQYSAESREFSEFDRSNPAAQEIVSLAESWYQRAGGRFAQLLRLDAKYSKGGTEPCLINGAKGSCVVLEITPRGRESSWKEKLWVEEQAGVVWKALTRWPASSRGMATASNTVWTRINIGGLVPESTFTFVPPRGSRRAVGNKR